MALAPTPAAQPAADMSLRLFLQPHYAPQWLLVMPQAYNVFLWLYVGHMQWMDANGITEAPDRWVFLILGIIFAVIGGMGYESAYIGAIAWSEQKHGNIMVVVTATAALICAVLIAYHVHAHQGGWAWLHAGFPFVSFCYTLAMHSTLDVPQLVARLVQQVRDRPVQRLLHAAEQQIEQLQRDLATHAQEARAALQRMAADLHAQQIAAQQAIDARDQQLAQQDRVMEEAAAELAAARELVAPDSYPTNDRAFLAWRLDQMRQMIAEDKSHEEIGRRFNMTRQRVGQVLAAAGKGQAA